MSEQFRIACQQTMPLLLRLHQQQGVERIVVENAHGQMCGRMRWRQSNESDALAQKQFHYLVRTTRSLAFPCRVESLPFQPDFPNRDRADQEKNCLSSASTWRSRGLNLPGMPAMAKT